MELENNKSPEAKEKIEKIKSAKAIILIISPDGIFLFLPKNNISKLPRKKLSYKGTHSLPGGKYQNEEDKESALIRELKEEIGLLPEHTISTRYIGKISTYDASVPTRILHSLFIVTVPGFWEANFEGDPDKEFNGYIKIPLFGFTNNDNIISEDEFEARLLKVINSLATQLFFATDMPDSSILFFKTDIPNSSPLSSETDMHDSSMLFFETEIPNSSISYVTSKIKNNLLRALAINGLDIPPEIIKKIINLQKILSEISDFSLKGTKEVTLRDYPITIIIPQSDSDNFTLVINIEQLVHEGKINEERLREILLISSYIFMQAKARGVLTNQHVIKFPKDQRQRLSQSEREKAVKIIKGFCGLLKERDYIKSYVIPTPERDDNSKHIILIEHGETLASKEEIKQLTFDEESFKPVIFPAHMHYLPLFKSSEESWKNILKELINTYYPESSSPKERDVFKGTFIDFPRILVLQERTLIEILNVFFGIYETEENENEKEDFETLSLLFTKALEFYRYFLGGKIPDNFSNQTKRFKNSETFNFRNLSDFLAFLNHGTEAIRVFKWTLFKIAYVINYYITHIKPKLSDENSEKTINMVVEKIKQAIGNRAIYTRKKTAKSIIIKLLRRGEAAENSFKDLIGIQIHLAKNDNPQEVIEKLLFELIDIADTQTSQKGVFELEVKGEIEGFDSHFFTPEVGVSKVTTKSESNFKAITIQFKINKIPVEIMIFLPEQHKRSEKGLNTHVLYDLVKILETLTRLFGRLPKNKVKDIIKEYLKTNPTNAYGNTLISEIYTQDKNKFIKDLQETGVDINKDVPEKDIFEKATRDQLLENPNINVFLDKLAEQLIDSFKNNGRVKAEKNSGNNTLLSFQFSEKDMQNWYNLFGQD